MVQDWCIQPLWKQQDGQISKHFVHKKTLMTILSKQCLTNRLKKIFFKVRFFNAVHQNNPPPIVCIGTVSHCVIVSIKCPLCLHLVWLFITVHQHTSEWCITIQNLVTKSSTVQKILFRQTLIEIFNLHSDLDFKNNNPVFSPGLWWCSIKLSLVAKV